MSDASTPPPDDSGDTRARLQTRSREGNRDLRRTGPGAFTLFIVMVVPLAAAGWVAWQQMEMQREMAALRAENAALQQRDGTDTNLLADIQQRQQALDTALQQRGEEFDAALQQRAQELEADLRERSQQVLRQTQERIAESDAESTMQAERLAVVERNLTALRRDLGREESDGVPLAEAELLLRFAEQRLLIARDRQTAIALYRQADEILRGVNDSAVLAVRDMLARELAALEAVPEIDVPGLFARLGALSARVDDFNVVVEGAVEDFAVQAPTSDVPVSGWWNNVKQTLGDYFVVTRSTADIAPQLDASDQFLLRTLVQLHIEQARLALLNSRPQLYRAALDDALAVAQRWLRGDGDSLDAYRAALEELRDTSIVSELPEVGSALIALQQVTTTGTATPAAPARVAPDATEAQADAPAPAADAPQ